MAALEILLLACVLIFLVLVVVKMDRNYRANQERDPKPPFKIVSEKRKAK